MKYLNIEPDSVEEKLQEVVVPEIRGLSVEDAQKILKQSKLDFEKEGNGNLVYDISPKPGVTVTENTKITIFTGYDINKDIKVVVPDFRNMTKKEIQDLAKSIGIKVNISGDGIGASQDILPGQEVDKNTTINILLEQPED